MDGAAAASLDFSSSSHGELQAHDEAPAAAAAESESLSLSRVPLADAPILLLIKFHGALRSELADLRRVTAAAAERGSYGGEFVSGLIRRVEFLKLAYKYHCAAEDEVVFPALDLHTKNVVSTYSLEHESIDGLFTSIFEHCDEINVENKDISQPFQELVFCLGTIQTTICQHMIKEEEQVFPLLMKQFSAREQASLVWQFICSVPMTLLQEFLPWMMSFLALEERLEVTNCLRDVVPNEKLLQEVIMSWLGSNEKPCKEVEPEDIKCVSNSQDSGQNPVDSLHLWHGAIMKDLKEVLKCLFQVKSCTETALSNLDSLVVQIKFLADVILFYRKALEKFFHPVFNRHSDASPISSDQLFLNDSHIEGLQRLLQQGAQDTIPLSNFLEKLCWDVESFIVQVSKQFTFQETEVLPVIRKSCNHKTQQQLLYMSLRTLPLGLLKCIVTWFSAHLSEGELRSIPHVTPKGYFGVNDSLVSLLHEWFRIGYLGKTSVEQFGNDLQKIFQTRSYFLHEVEQVKEAVGTSSLSSNIHSYKGSNSEQMELLSTNNKSFTSPSSFGVSHTASVFETSYSSGINLQIHFPGTTKVPCPYTKHLYEERPHSALNQPKPIDLIFLFHKALKKELDYFVLGSAQLVENVGILTEFIRRFKLVKYLYQIHTDAEDQIAFPALEKKGKFQNISGSYTMDHKLEVHQFSRISFTLHEMSELHAPIFYAHANRKIFSHQQLCLELHDMCKSLHKSLSDHVNREEIELWPLFREFFTIEEQENLIGAILGRTKAEILQDMIPWQMAYLTPDDQHDMMSMFHQVTRNTMFNEWLREWWKGYDHDPKKVAAEVTTITPSLTSDPLEIISKYLSKEATDVCEENIFGKTISSAQKEWQSQATDVDTTVKFNLNDETKDLDGNQQNETLSECTKLSSQGVESKGADVIIDDMTETERPKEGKKLSQHDHLLTISQGDLEAVIRRVSRDSSLDSKSKSYLIQNLLMSRWIATHQVSQLETNVTTESQGFSGQYPSYRDSLKISFGCKHYKRNCKLLAPCCNQLYTCIHCHDEVTDHSLDRKSITKMMCMKCLIVQPIGKTCSTVSCGNLSMGKYFCKICKLFDDSRIC
ncbi:zinc finger protein BRUTUS-like At1g18910 isoform X2 [Momordica charantia]|uniref:Zinc finger protein BRUTUS-like At1g18910 isoform X2 n=1 Tax=Momordica charantia TaxID=3673 RepID=A0A6J1C0A6_MOMCH|nr:zinc finger protein BRUTUS-like At1g18910 isoform X2 [Momordica charantia]